VGWTDASIWKILDREDYHVRCLVEGAAAGARHPRLSAATEWLKRNHLLSGSWLILRAGVLARMAGGRSTFHLRREKVNGKVWKAWLVPGGVLLALAVGLVNSPALGMVAPSLSFYYVAVFAGGLLLAWRFNSSRILFCLLTLLLAHRAVEFFSNGQVRGGPGHTAVALCAVLIPLNFIVFASRRERGLTVAGIAPRFVLLVFESVVVAVACRPENSSVVPRGRAVGEIPLWLLPVFFVAIALLVRRYLQTRRPIEPGFAWSTAAVLLWLELAPIGKSADAYVGTAGLIIAASLIETSYVLAYHDELTGIRGRRAFNEALVSLDQTYAIAIVDIDHFKRFNDTYGHDVGDQVLCSVATRISEVGGDGQAFRCGGEEFAVIFPDTSAKDALEHLEALRRSIQDATFRVRGSERRAEPRPGETDRRRPSRKKTPPGSTLSQPPDRLSVTVSIGVAEPSTRYRQPEQVIEAADQALYRAKERGRNRVEAASTIPLRVETRRVKASRTRS
jgi:GGDEF domain-containing protein